MPFNITPSATQPCIFDMYACNMKEEEDERNKVKKGSNHPLWRPAAQVQRDRCMRETKKRVATNGLIEKQTTIRAYVFCTTKIIIETMKVSNSFEVTDLSKVKRFLHRFFLIKRNNCGLTCELCLKPLDIQENNSITPCL